MPEISEDELKLLKEKAESVDTIAASKRRLEEENAKIKSRAKEAEGKLSEVEKAKLEAEGKTQELLEAERKEKLELQNKFQSTRKSVLKEKLRTEAMKLAPDAHDIDLVLKVPEFQQSLKLDEESLTIEGVEDYLAKVREKKSFMFKKKGIDVDNTPPAKNEDKKPKTDNQKFLDELNKCKTMVEMDAVRKKYGKF